MTSGGNYSSQVPAGEDYREVQLPDYKVQEGKHLILRNITKISGKIKTKMGNVLWKGSK